MMASSSLIPGCHVMSDLLTIREKGILISLLGQHCKLLKSTVAQILQAKSTQGENPSWHCLDCGVVCLTEDESLHSYFLRLYCVKRAKLLWEQELYIPFKYTPARSYFHTFPAEGYQVGLNFANETEAEEFLLAMEAVCVKMTTMIDMTQVEIVSSLLNDPFDMRKEPEGHMTEEKHFPVDILPLGLLQPQARYVMFKDLDPAMSRMLMQARLSEEDLKDKDVAGAVEHIINQFGGLKAVQRELQRRGQVSQTLSRAAGASISLTLHKEPLPPVPPIKNCTTSQQASHGNTTLKKSQFNPWMSSHLSAPAPERKRKSTSFKHVSPTEAERDDAILSALREVFKQKQALQQRPSEFSNPMDPDTNNDNQF